MSHPRFLALGALLALALRLPGPIMAETPTWMAGLSRAKITPQQPQWMAGYAGRTHPAEGTLHDLWIKVLALKTPDGRRAVVVTSDIEGYPGPMYDRICRALKQQCGLEAAQLKLTCSHTHSAPVLWECSPDCYPLDDQQQALVKQYTLDLERTIVAKIAEALAQLAPATLQAVESQATFAVNRRNNREKEVPEMRLHGESPKGPSDHGVPILVVRSPQGALRAVVFGYACHSTVLGLYQWSGDYPGFAQLALERDHPHCQAMFYQGCGADQNPVPRRTVELCQQYGEQLAAAVNQGLQTPARPIAPRLATALQIVDLPLQPLPARVELEKAAAGRDYRARWSQRMLGLLDARQPLPLSYPLPVQAWKLGDQLWISLGGETVVDYALTLKAKYGPQTWVNGYTNDVIAYIPSQRVWDEGGYEAGGFQACGLASAGWAAGIETQLMDTVARLVRQLQADR